MTNREIEEKLSRAVRKETPDVLERVLSACGENREIIDMIEQGTKRKRTWAIWAATAAVLLIAVGGGIGWNYGWRVDSVIAIDVNPSVELRTSQSERVLDARALNKDAAEILDGMELEGVRLDVAVNALIGSMVKQGYIDEVRNSILVSVESGSPERGARLQNEVAASVNEALQQYPIPAAVVKQSVNEDDELKALAESYGISSGRASLIRRIMELDQTLGAEQLSGLNVNDLTLLLLARQPDGLDVAYGEVSDGRYIGEKKAEEIALNEVPGGTITKLEFDFEDGRPCYETELTRSGEKYEFDIDAETGEVTKWKAEAEDSGTLSAGEARAIAEKKVPGGKVTKVELEDDDGRLYYEVRLTAQETRYEFEIDADTGEILKWEKKDSTADSASSLGYTAQLTADEAKKAALDHAGVKEQDASSVRVRLDEEEGRLLYDVEFTAGGTEYDYELDAVTGEIRKSEREAAAFVPSGTENISEEQAKKLVLERVPGAELTEWKTDTDDGKRTYEGKLRKGSSEYEFKIDAVTGDFLEWEEDAAD